MHGAGGEGSAYNFVLTNCQANTEGAECVAINNFAMVLIGSIKFSEKMVTVNKVPRKAEVTNVNFIVGVMESMEVGEVFAFKKPGFMETRAREDV